jgi:hypothetical protein
MSSSRFRRADYGSIVSLFCAIAGVASGKKRHAIFKGGSVQQGHKDNFIERFQNNLSTESADRTLRYIFTPPLYRLQGDSSMARTAEVRAWSHAGLGIQKRICSR